MLIKISDSVYISYKSIAELSINESKTYIRITLDTGAVHLYGPRTSRESIYTTLDNLATLINSKEAP